MDVPATILADAGVQIPEVYEGRSLVPLVEGEQVGDWRTDFFCEHLMHRADIPKYEGVRGSRYVYARYFEHLPEGEFLHDLQTDPKQLENLAGNPERAATLQKLRARCNELRDEWGGGYTQERWSRRR